MLWCGFFFFFKQKTAYEMRISDWSSDVCSSDLFRSAATGGSDDPAQPGTLRGRRGYVRPANSSGRDVPDTILSRDRKSVVSGKSVTVRVDLGGRRIIKKKKRQQQHRTVTVRKHHIISHTPHILSILLNNT